MTVEIQHLVDGHWRAGSGSLLESRNPAKPEEVVANAHMVGAPEVQLAVDAAVKAADDWARTPSHERGLILRRAAELLEQRADEYGAELTREEGKTLAEGTAEVRRAAEIFRFNSGEADRDAGEIYSSPRRMERILVVRKPVGVVGVITPWNFPIAIPSWKIAPALAHGNVVIWKPASLAPLLAYRLAQTLDEAGLPRGVLSLLVGPGEIGSMIAENPGTNAVTFTGSTETGTALSKRCAALRKPVQTEMGGKNAAVVLSDADLESAAEQVVLGAMGSTGQKCTATSRVVVDESVASEFLGQVAERISSLVVGNGLEPDVFMGPAVSASAQQKIVAALDESVSTGGQIIARVGPEEGGHGYFVPATAVLLPDTNQPLWREEVFGPVLAVVTARDDEQAFDLANDSNFGLSAAVFTKNLGRAMSAMEELDVGMLHVNSETTGADPHVPFGGAKDSGYGPKEQGRASREFFTRLTTIYLRGTS